MGRKKQRKLKETAPSKYPVTAVFRRLGERHVRSIDTGAYHAEQTIREKYGDEASRLLSALPPEDQMQVASDMVERIKDGRMKSDDVPLWLFMRVRQAADAAAAVKAERSRGGDASTAARRAPWKPWQEWVCKHPSRRHPNFQRDIIRVIQGRARGRPIKETERVRNVPDNLPPIYGMNGKPPSEDSIRRNLFDSRVR